MKLKLQVGVYGAMLAAMILVNPWTSLAESSDTAPSETALRTARTIRREAMRAPGGAAGHPLPLAATWSPGNHNFSPDYQIERIKQGHHLLLCFSWPYADTMWGGTPPITAKHKKRLLDNFAKHYEQALREAGRLQLPVSFQRLQFEMGLSRDRKYFELPPAENPNVIRLDGTVQGTLDPMGPIEPWRQIGRELVTSVCMHRAQELYPDPPMVIFLSNNEHNILQPKDAEKSKRFVDKYGTERDIHFKRKVFSEALIERYHALQEGMREGLISEAWKKNLKFVAYEAFGPSHLGRWYGWQGHSYYTPERVDWEHLAWDGGSPSYYTHHWAPFLTDYTSASIQVEAMNWVFMLKDVLEDKPNFWFELSTWDGDQTGANLNQPGIHGKRAQYLGRGGQIYNADRYEGMLQFGLWLLRPRALRDFRYLESLEYAEPYYLANVHPVDRVYASSLLQKFWRRGELVPNPDRDHPYNSKLPENIKQKERWFLLENSLTPDKKNWGLYTELTVFPLALVLGEAPEREWLVFAHAPRGARTDVTVELPEFGGITIDASVTGSFYHVKETDGSVSCVIHGGPPSALPAAAAERPEPGQAVAFEATNVFSPENASPKLAWDFTDGTKEDGTEASHVFSRRGLYPVALTATTDNGNSSTHYLPVSVGYPELKDCLLFLPLDKAPKIGIEVEQRIPGKHEWRRDWLGAIFAANTTEFTALNVGCEWAEDEERGEVLHVPGNGAYVALHTFYSAETNPKIPRYDALGRDRTTALWFKVDDVTTRQVLYQDGSSNSNIINIYVDNGKLYTGISSKPGTHPEWDGTWLDAQVEAGKWHHVAFVLDNADKDELTECFHAYLNGQRIGSGQALLNRPNWARIGGNWSTRFHDGESAEHSPSVNGLIDEVAVFSTAFSEEEIRNLMKLEEY